MVVPLGSAMAVPHGSAMAEHVLRKIHDCTFRPKYFLRDFLDQKSPENFHFNFFHRPQIVVFSQLFSKKPFFLPESHEKFPFHPSKILTTFFTRRHHSTAYTAFHHCTFSFITRAVNVYPGSRLTEGWYLNGS